MLSPMQIEKEQAPYPHLDAGISMKSVPVGLAGGVGSHRALDLAALPQHMAVSLWLTVKRTQIFRRLRLRRRSLKKELEFGGKPQAFRSVLRQSRTSHTPATVPESHAIKAQSAGHPHAASRVGDRDIQAMESHTSARCRRDP